MATGTVLTKLVLEGDGKVKRGIEKVGNAMTDTAGDSGVLSGSLGQLAGQLKDVITPATLAGSRIDKAGDEAAEAGRQASRGALGFAALSASTSGIGASIGLLSTNLIGVAGALSAISIAAAPVVAGLAGIAAGFVAVAGVMGLGLFAGAATHAKELGKAIKAAKKQIQKIIKPIGKLFGPVLLKGVKALPKLTRRIVDAIGNLKPFRDALLEMGRAAMKYLPQMARAFGNLARTALPLFVQMTKAIMSGLAPAIRWLSTSMTDLQAGYSDVIGPARKFWKRTKELRTALGPLVNEIQRFAKNILVAGLNLGGKLLPLLTPLVTGLTKAVRWFNDLSAGVQRAGLIVGAAVGAFITLGGTLGGLVGTVTTVASVLGTLVALFNPITLAIGGVVAAVTALGLAFSGEFKTIRKVVGRVGTFIKKALGAAITWIRTNAVPLAKKALGRLADAAVTGFQILQKKLPPLIQKAINAGITWIRTKGIPLFKKGLQALVTGAVSILKTLGTKAKKWVSSAVGKIVSYVKSIGKKDIKNAFKAVGKGIRTALLGFLSMAGKVGKVVSQFIGGVASYLKNDAKGDLKTAITVAMDGLTKAAKLALQALTPPDGIITKIIGDIASYLKNQAFSDLKAAAEVLVGAITAAFEGLYQGLIGGSLVPEMFSAIASYISGKATNAIRNATETLGRAIESAFKNAKGWVEDVVDNMISNIKSAINDAISWMKSTFNAAIPDSLSIPSVTLGGGTVPGTDVGIPTVSVGGQSIDLPQLDSGGMITDTGVFVGHEGERVLNPAETRQYNSGGGGGATFAPHTEINIEGDATDETVDLIEKKLNRRDDQWERRFKRLVGRPGGQR